MTHVYLGGSRCVPCRYTGTAPVLSWFTLLFVKFTCISKLLIALQPRKIGEQRTEIILLQKARFAKAMSDSRSRTGTTTMKVPVPRRTVGTYHLAKKSGNFGLNSNGKVIFRKFRSEIVEYLQRYSSFSVRNGTAEISLPFA